MHRPDHPIGPWGTSPRVPYRRPLSAFTPRPRSDVPDIAAPEERLRSARDWRKWLYGAGEFALRSIGPHPAGWQKDLGSRLLRRWGPGEEPYWFNENLYGISPPTGLPPQPNGQGGRVSESERRQRAQEQTRMAQNMRNRQGPRMYAADWMQEIVDKIKAARLQQDRLEDRKGAPNLANTGLGPTLPGIERPPNWRVAEDYSVVPSSFYRFDPYGTPSGRPYVEGFEGISPDVLQEIAKRWGETYARRKARSPWRQEAMMADPGHPGRWPDNAPPRGWFNDPIVNPWSADRQLLGERAWPQDKFRDYMGNYIDAMANVPMPRHWYEDYSAIPFR